jgi:hypothetical protein
VAGERLVLRFSDTGRRFDLLNLPEFRLLRLPHGRAVRHARLEEGDGVLEIHAPDRHRQVKASRPSASHAKQRHLPSTASLNARAVPLRLVDRTPPDHSVPPVRNANFDKSRPRSPCNQVERELAHVLVAIFCHAVLLVN